MIQQVLLNLINNGFDAILARHGAQDGCLAIEAGPGEDRQNVRIRVRDNGCGIHPDNLKRIFSLFSPPSLLGREPGWDCPCVSELWTK